MELKTLVELTEHEASAVMQMVRHVVQMRELGLIVTVENRPLLPLAMGHHEPLITVYRRIDHKAEAAERGGALRRLRIETAIRALNGDPLGIKNGGGK